MKQLYDVIGTDYDCTRACDPGVLEQIIELLNAPLKSHILDVGCGTGNYTIALSKYGYQMSGLDISDTMLNSAKEKQSDVEWHKGDANHIPFDSSIFDGCICTLACHHFKELREAFAEVYRVINKGRFVIFSCSHKQIRNYWLYRYFPNELELITTYMPDIDMVIDSLCASKFRIIRVDSFFVTANLQDNFLGARFEHPELYLKKSFRDGMSIFAKMADDQSVQTGCERLKRDIETGEFDRYIAQYKNYFGDYYFITAEKREPN